MTDRQEKQLKQWHRSLLALNRGHFKAAAMCERRNIRLGVPATFLATVTGTTIFATLTNSPQSWARILVGLLSFAVAILASLQTFLRYAERAQQHKEAGQKFGILRRRIEATFAGHSSTDGVLPQEFFTNIATQWDQSAKESPPLPQKIHDREYEEAAGQLG